MLSRAIPVQILEHITDEVADDIPTLCSLALTSQQLVPRCRHYLYSRVTWVCDDMTPHGFLALGSSNHKLLATLASSPTICSRIRHLTIPSPNLFEVDGFLDSLFAVLQSTSSHLQSLTLDRWVWKAVPEQLLTFLSLPAFVQVTTLALDQCLFFSPEEFRQFLLGFPALEHLEFSLLAILRGMRDRSTRKGPKVLRAKSLKCSSIDVTGLFYTFTEIKIDSLCLECPQQANPKEIDRILEIVDPALDALELNLMIPRGDTAYYSLPDYSSLTLSRFKNLTLLGLRFNQWSGWYPQHILSFISEDVSLRELRIYVDTDAVPTLLWGVIGDSLSLPKFSNLQHFTVCTDAEQYPFILGTLRNPHVRSKLRFMEDREISYRHCRG